MIRTKDSRIFNTNKPTLFPSPDNFSNPTLFSSSSSLSSSSFFSCNFVVIITPFPGFDADECRPEKAEFS
jgi:hypothetical protein